MDIDASGSGPSRRSKIHAVRSGHFFAARRTASSSVLGNSIIASAFFEAGGSLGVLIGVESVERGLHLRVERLRQS